MHPCIMGFILYLIHYSNFQTGGVLLRSAFAHHGCQLTAEGLNYRGVEGIGLLVGQGPGESRGDDAAFLSRTPPQGDGTVCRSVGSTAPSIETDPAGGHPYQ